MKQRESGIPRAAAVVLALLAVLLAGCARRGIGMPATTALPAPPATASPAETIASATVEVTGADSPVLAEPSAPTPAPTQTTTSVAPAGAVDRGPFNMAESHCGLRLPVVPSPEVATEHIGAPAADLSQIPEEARPAVAFMLSNPDKVGLAAYQVGQEGEGLYLNAHSPLPLASVVKVLHLVAYARAVQLGELDPATVVPLSELERFYLSNSDIGSHPRAVAALVAAERVFGEPPSVYLEDVPRMMMEFSSNAATDYLHMLLGQERIEETAISLGMVAQTAPCPFLGQFLLMGRRDDGPEPVMRLVANPRLYSREVMALTERYSSDETFRQQVGGWQDRDNRPSIEAQQLLSEQLNAHGSAREYANLMAQIASNTLGPWEESVRIRRYMEWPTHFEANQERLAWLGYKGGSLPGVLTVVYYAQPWDAAQPIVVALFFHDLPLETYREWRRSLPHDELALWLLRDRQAIPLLRALVD